MFIFQYLLFFPFVHLLLLLLWLLLSNYFHFSIKHNNSNLCSKRNVNKNEKKNRTGFFFTEDNLRYNKQHKTFLLSVFMQSIVRCRRSSTSIINVKYYAYGWSNRFIGRKIVILRLKWWGLIILKLTTYTIQLYVYVQGD